MTNLALLSWVHRTVHQQPPATASTLDSSSKPSANSQMAETPPAPTDKAKGLSRLSSSSSQTVMVDHLDRLIEAVNRREPTPARAGIEHTTGINRAIALADAVTKYQNLRKAIELRLDKSGSNFPVWRVLLATTVGIVFKLSKYFDEDATDYQPDRGRLVGILVENSVHVNLVPDIQGKQGWREQSMRYSSSTGGGDRGSVMWRSVEWARWVLNDRNPCRYCWEWGHWVNDCHLKKACKPPLGDPRHLNPNYRLKKTVRAGAVLDSPAVRALKLEACCETCAATKATQAVVSLPSRDICKEPGDVIAADLIGPYKKSVHGCQYVLTFRILRWDWFRQFL
ncbi:hypothetical protein VP01_3153g3 [Puccinia sorghi]|uniref:CCHC-type domain-containing protein n=1 Tax=Puccinia sorghi TaxID=27349 RepID=A0A0L6V0Q8_9BASI|nr:hypothetical protein VP01_3153g3 [Puccinia sorghi]